ncbi:DUF6119 family protein [Ursidibacter sp. B-7004-1]
MSQKQHTFSIYLLKEKFTESNAIKASYITEGKLNRLEKSDWDSEKVPDSTLYIRSSDNIPEWKRYFGIRRELNTVSQGAILFLPISISQISKIRYFAITFGHSYHALKKNSIDHSFGLITTLNALDPDKSIRTIDTVFPENDKRERIQSPTFTSLSFFQFNKHESLVKSLQGKVQKQYQDIFNNITGTHYFKCNSKKELRELKTLCENLFSIFLKDDYKNSFPELTYITPISDPEKIDELNEKLLNSIKNNEDLHLSIPNIIDPTISIEFEINGIDNIPEKYDEILYDNYLDYLNQSKFSIKNITLNNLEEHNITCINIDNQEFIETYSIYECISYDTLDKENETYHLCDGHWYKINKEYIELLRTDLDPIFISNHRVLSDYNHNSEGDYNLDMENNNNVICLDKTNISPKGQSQIEPCDLISLENNEIHFIHVKRDTKSSSLSHLFNQGLNSICLLRSNTESKEKLEKIISRNQNILNGFQNSEQTVIYGIISKKDPNKKSENLPLFSRISLLRSLEQYKLLKVNCQVIYIKQI